MSDKTPASRQLLNITKALLDDANNENERLRAALEEVRSIIHHALNREGSTCQKNA